MKKLNHSGHSNWANWAHWKISIGTKFLVLIGILLGTTLATFLFNAAHLFKKDNLDSIYLSSDILTSSKAGEVRTWLASSVAQAKSIGESLAGAHVDAKADGTVLVVDLFSTTSDRTASWAVTDISKRNLSQTELEAELKKMVAAAVLSGIAKEEDKILAKTITAQSQTVILLALTLPSKDGKIQILGTALSTSGLSEIFSKTGPYMLFLMDDHGQMLMSTEGSVEFSPDQLISLPIVKRMLTTHLDRELQEFSFKDQAYLGAYQRLGIAGLSVLSQVSKSIALETAQTLIRRSIMIGLLLFLAAFICTSLFVKKLTDPILKLRNAAKRMSEGNFDVRVEVKSRDEIYDLAASFNSMSAELELKIRNLYRINEASGKIRAFSNNREILDFSVEFLSSLLNCELGLGLYFAGKKDTATGKQKIIYSKKNWPNSDISLKKLTATLAKTRGIGQCWINDLPFLVCPIFHHDQLTGLIILGGRNENQEFKPEEHFMARTVVAMVSADTESLQYQSELRELNADLENRVTVRTQELASQKKELDDVMNNIQQGILTINENLTINSDYSKYTNSLFGMDSLANVSICDLLFPTPAQAREKQNLLEWLQSIFMDPSMFETIQDFGLRELEFNRKTGDGLIESRFFNFQWKPIYENDQMIKIMLVCFDLTEQKRLEREILKQEEDHKEELQIISKLVNNPVEMVEQFISDFSRNLASGLLIFTQLNGKLDPESLAPLMRVLHTLKGSAKQFGLESVQKRVHDLEESVADHTRNTPNPAQIPAILEKFRFEFEVVEQSLKKMISVYEKIMKSGKDSAHAGSSLPSKPSVSIPLEKLESLVSRISQGKNGAQASTVKQSLFWLLQSPIHPLFQRLEKLAITLANELQYEVQVTMKGEQTQIDSRLLPILYDAFLHIIRNSLDHGGEPAEVRESKGKPGPIQISFSASNSKTGEVSVSVADDGKGIHDQIVLKKALEKKLITPALAKTMSHEEIILLIFRPGFSTKEAVTDISGRGVGMDVVKDTAEKTLKGKLRVTSQLDQGTRIEFVFSAQTLFASASSAKPEFAEL